MGRIEGHADGELAEFAVAADLVGEYDCRVSYTHGSYRCDLIADHEDCLLRIQVKKANRDNDDPWRYKIFTDGYTPDEADVFAGYAVEEDKVFYETVEAANNEVRVIGPCLDAKNHPFEPSSASSTFLTAHLRTSSRN